VRNHVAANIKLSQYFVRTAQSHQTPCYWLRMLFLPLTRVYMFSFWTFVRQTLSDTQQIVAFIKIFSFLNFSLSSF